MDICDFSIEPFIIYKLIINIYIYIYIYIYIFIYIFLYILIINLNHSIFLYNFMQVFKPSIAVCTNPPLYLLLSSFTTNQSISQSINQSISLFIYLLQTILYLWSWSLSQQSPSLLTHYFLN